MGVYIKGVEMPKTCNDCPLLDWDLSYIKCGVVNRKFEVDEEHFRESRVYDCPLIEIPPHGDLIDRDELLSQYGGPIWTEKTDYAEGLRDVVADIKNAPTVIEAEEGE